MTKDYEKLVSDLSKENILEKWSEVTPMSKISGIPRSAGSVNSKDSGELFDGHNEEQVKLMEELCIVLDYNDTPVGAGTKKVCHIMDNINEGLLHRAFSVFLFNKDNKLLLQQRADEKITFPGMWTNTCCSHPLCVSSELGLMPAAGRSDINDLDTAIEGAKVAAQRKLEHELGIPLEQSPVEKFQFLTRIHYKSASGGESSKWGEHEIDYILIIRTDNDISINPNDNEIKDHRYVSQEELKEMFKDQSLVFTPWFKLICETFLFEWWNNLSSLDKYKDANIHRLL